jgi:hypothetical protein
MGGGRGKSKGDGKRVDLWGSASFFPSLFPFFPFFSFLLTFLMLISPLLPSSLPTLATDGADGQRTRAPKSKNGNKMVVRERPRGKDGKQ